MMDSPPLPAVVHALVDYSLQRATAHQVMRAVASHEDWFVPSLYAGSTLGRVKQELVMLGSAFRAPAHGLLLYTDLESALFAYEQAGLRLGPYARRIRGVDLFRALPPDLESIVVNEGLPTERKLYLSAPSFGNVAVWASVMEVERVLADEQVPVPALVDAIRAYDAFLVACHGDGSLVVLEGDETRGAAGLLFTAPDCFDAFQAAFSDVALTRAATTGARVCEAADALDVETLVINVCGPGPVRVVSPAQLRA